MKGHIFEDQNKNKYQNISCELNQRNKTYY